jgi:hypothetical protein
MGLYKGSVNPLNVLEIRRLKRMPPNFSKIHLKNFYDTKSLEHWIYLNLNSRFCIKKSTSVDNNKLITVIEVGIEDAKELSMLTLACPLLANATLSRLS